MVVLLNQWRSLSHEFILVPEAGLSSIFKVTLQRSHLYSEVDAIHFGVFRFSTHPSHLPIGNIKLDYQERIETGLTSAFDCLL